MARKPRRAQDAVREDGRRHDVASHDAAVAATKVAAAGSEQADVIAGSSGTAAGVVALSKSGPRIVEFSIVNGQAIFEGDIDLGTPGELEIAAQALAMAAGEMQAAVVADTSKRWPGARVAYEPLPQSSPIAAVVAQALALITSRTPVRFVMRGADDVDYLAFEVSAFCSSQVGRSGGRQIVRLSANCSTGNAVHELCHALGLWHEQSREDRDRFIRVRWENVLPGYEHNFRQQLSDGDDVGQYDFDSIMHYPPNAFTRNGQPTLEALAGQPVFGQRNDLSGGDIAAIRFLYSGAGAPSSPTGAVMPGIGEGIQFEVTIQGGGVAQVVTDNWPAGMIVHWDVICTEGPAGIGPLIAWDCEVGRSADGRVDYFFRIRNLVGELVTAQARYIVHRP